MEDYNMADCVSSESWEWEGFGQQARAKEEEQY
jgi:hypothetical protein